MKKSVLKIGDLGRFDQHGYIHLYKIQRQFLFSY